MSFAGIARRALRAIPKETTLPVLSGPNRGKKWVVGSGDHGHWIGWYESHCSAEIDRAGSRKRLQSSQVDGR